MTPAWNVIAIFRSMQRLPRRGRTDEAAHQTQVGQHLGALVAPFEMRAHGDLIADRQFVVVIFLEERPRLLADEDLHAVLASLQAGAQRLARAREARLHRADGDAKRERDFVVAQTIHFTQNDGGALIERKRVERLVQAGGEFLLREDTVGSGFGAALEVAVRLDVRIERHLIARRRRRQKRWRLRAWLTAMR